MTTETAKRKIPDSIVVQLWDNKPEDTECTNVAVLNYYDGDDEFDYYGGTFRNDNPKNKTTGHENVNDCWLTARIAISGHLIEVPLTSVLDD